MSKGVLKLDLSDHNIYKTVNEIVDIIAFQTKERDIEIELS